MNTTDLKDESFETIGANQAIEVRLYADSRPAADDTLQDAYVLGTLLARELQTTPSKDLESILKAYDTVRRPHANAVADRSLRIARAAAYMEASGLDINAVFAEDTDWISAGHADDEVQKATAVLKELRGVERK